MSSLWSTPQPIFDKLNTEFNFTLDVCAIESNRKCPAYFSPEVDGLAQPWGLERCWMNPPYGEEIALWMEKAWRSAMAGALVVALVPGRTNPPWWHDYVMYASEIRFIRTKVAFVPPAGDDRNGVPFTGAVIAVFRPGVSKYPAPISSWIQPQHEKSTIPQDLHKGDR